MFSEQIIKGFEFSLYKILLSTPVECITVVGRKLITKGLILRTEYAYRRRNPLTVFEVPTPVHGEHLALYRKQHGEILDKQAFITVPSGLDVSGRNKTIIVIGQKPTLEVRPDWPPGFFFWDSAPVYQKLSACH